MLRLVVNEPVKSRNQLFRSDSVYQLHQPAVLALSQDQRVRLFVDGAVGEVMTHRLVAKINQLWAPMLLTKKTSRHGRPSSPRPITRTSGKQVMKCPPCST